MKNNWILLTFLSLIIFSCGKAEREDVILINGEIIGFKDKRKSAAST